MPFHVEIRRGRRWAREFNLEAERLHRDVLEPWLAGRTIRLGERDWKPSESSLKILEGPELSTPDLAFGRGWDRAEREGKPVARQLLASAARDAAMVAVLAETEAAEEAVIAALRGLGIPAVSWDDAAGLEPAALVLAVESSRPPGSWLFAAGAAVGSVGGRAVVICMSDAPPPPELGELVTVAPLRELAPALAEILERIVST